MAIAINISAQLWNPVPLVDCWHSTVFGTAVPEAAVHKHRHSVARENYVRPHASARKIQPEILAEPPTAGVQRCAERNLGLGIGPPVCGEVP